MSTQHILILPTLERCFDGKLVIYGIELEFLFSINVLVRNTKTSCKLLRFPKAKAGQALPSGSAGSWGLPYATPAAGVTECKWKS